MTRTELQRLYALYEASSGVSTDTRTLKSGELFFALKGPNFDGNAYAAEALDKGAAVVVADAPPEALAGDDRVFVAQSSLAALQELASLHRQKLGATVIGLTGSNGKTTTKSLLAAMLGRQFRVFATPGNFNNHIGLPLTILRAKQPLDFLILEMGDNQPGDIAELCAIAEPDSGLIANIGRDHIANYEDMSENAATKCELFDSVNQEQGMLFLNQDDPLLREYPASQSLTYGFGDATVRGFVRQETLHGLTLGVQLPGGQSFEVESKLSGGHNAQNILAAATVAWYYAASPEAIAAAAAAFEPDANRSRLIERGEKTVWLDAYNANPDSVSFALRHFLNHAPPEETVLILGDMEELGALSEEAHREICALAESLNPKALVAVGPKMRAGASVCQTLEVFAFEDAEELAAAPVGKQLPPFTHALVKGSRAARLERVVDWLFE